MCVVDSIQVVLPVCQPDSCPDPNTQCWNTSNNDAFFCECNPGWELSVPGQNCTDVNECDRPDVCPSNMHCNNLLGTYECICNDGFVLTDNVCTDVDECGDYVCSIFANCTNIAGSYACKCLDGYTGNGTSCLDINECNNSPCDPVKEVCVNYNGWYQCECANGFNSTETDCIDFDECTLAPCLDKNAECKNTPGSFECSCKSGFEGNGTTCTTKPQPTSPATRLNFFVTFAIVAVAHLLAVL